MPFLSRGLRTHVGFVLICGLAACQSSSPTAAPTPLPPSPLALAALTDLSASVDSPQAGHQINCRNDVIAQVTLTNHGKGALGVAGVRKVSKALAGGCFAAPDFTYGVAAIGVGPGEAVLVMDRALYLGGSGCCLGAAGCGGEFTCTFEEDLTVLTNVGDVPAGSFSYDVNFNNCAICASASASSVNRCPPPAH